MSTAPNDLIPTHPRFSRVQWALLCAASGLSLLAFAWWAADMIYTDRFTSPSAWWVIVLSALALWIMLVARGGQERIMRDLSDLAERLDQYGDAREIDGHRTASTIRGNSRPPLYTVGDGS